jgi:hypothetical protein
MYRASFRLDYAGGSLLEDLERLAENLATFSADVKEVAPDMRRWEVSVPKQWEGKARTVCERFNFKVA